MENPVSATPQNSQANSNAGGDSSVNETPQAKKPATFEDVSRKISKSSTLSKEAKEIFKCLLTVVASITNDRDKKISTLEQKMEANRIKHEEQILCLQNQINTLNVKMEKSENSDKQIQKLRDYVDENDQYERRDSLIISGNITAFTDGEDCKLVVHHLLKDRCQYNLRVEDISIAHRSGAKPNAGVEDKRSIRFRVCRRDLVHDIIASCTKVQKRLDLSSRIFVNVSLTPLRSKIYFCLRKLRKNNVNAISSCRSNYTGNIEVYTPKPGGAAGTEERADGRSTLRTVINTRAELERFMNDRLGMNLEALGVQWD